MTTVRSPGSSPRPTTTDASSATSSNSTKKAPETQPPRTRAAQPDTPPPPARPEVDPAAKVKGRATFARRDTARAVLEGRLESISPRTPASPPRTPVGIVPRNPAPSPELGPQRNLPSINAPDTGWDRATGPSPLAPQPAQKPGLNVPDTAWDRALGPSPLAPQAPQKPGLNVPDTAWDRALGRSPLPSGTQPPSSSTTDAVKPKRAGFWDDIIERGREAANSSAPPPPLPGTENLTPEQQAQAREAVENIQDASSGMNSSDGDTRDAATLATTRALDRELAGLDPAVQEAVLRNVDDELEQVGENIGRLDRDETREATASLSRATQSVGQDRAALLTDPIAKTLQTSLEEDGSNLDELGDGIKDAVVAGDGALFGASLTLSMDNAGLSEEASRVGFATATGIEEVRSDFAEAQEDADRLSAEASLIAQQTEGIFTPEEQQAGMDAFREEHKETYDRANAEAERLSTTMEGAALLDANREQVQDLPDIREGIATIPAGAIADVASSTLQEIPRMAQNPAGAEAVHNAVLAGADGGNTFITGANELAGRLEGDEATRLQEGMTTALGHASTYGMEVLSQEGRIDEAPELLEAYARASGNPDFAAGYEELADTARASIEAGSNPLELGIELAAKSNDLAKELFPAANDPPSADDLARQQRFQLVGASLSTAAFIHDPSISSALDAGEDITKLIRPNSRAAALASGPGAVVDLVALARDPSLETALGAVSSAAGLGQSFAVAAGRTVLARGLGSVALVAGVGLSAVEAFQAFRRGDELGAIAAGAPAVGAGVGFAVGGPPGAAIGFAVGAVVGFGINLARSIFGDDPIEKFEERTESFWRGALEAAGLPPDAAGQLRDVNGDLQGVGQAITGVAEALGMEPRELLEQIARLPEDERRDAVKQLLALPNNGKDILEDIQEGKTPPPFRMEPWSFGGNIEDFLKTVFPDSQVPGLLERLAGSGLFADV